MPLPSNIIAELYQEVTNMLPIYCFEKYSVKTVATDSFSLYANNSKEYINVINNLGYIEKEVITIRNKDVGSAAFDGTDSSVINGSLIGKYVIIEPGYITTRCSFYPRNDIVSSIEGLMFSLKNKDISTAYQYMKRISIAKYNAVVENNTLSNDRLSFTKVGKVTPCKL